MTVNALPQTELDLEVLVARKEAIADDVVRLTFRHPGGEPLPPWLPGAHLDLVLQPGLVRQYSLCGDPGDRSVLEVAVLRERASRGGSELVHTGLHAGDLVRIRGPRNHFPLVAAQRYLFIAGGIGITPIVPMIAAADEAGAEWQLMYGGRTRSSMAFHQELSQKYGDRVRICPRDEGGLPELRDLFATAPEGTSVYCCGPEALLTDAERRHADRPSVSLHVERFSPKENNDPGTEFEVELARSGITVTVPADRSILEVAEDAGVPVLSSCQEGVCGTCETAVLEGVPDHRDSVLTEDEQAANDTMMICVSRACGRRLVLDL
ncbi:PDR/VanB family oxidoreductase [Amycolatopsis sp. GM8]|uniref:PDR/VanB family oxidoreductase n=1 Tax=Amycolatopsis sp. GM8 TaxID=2896530 RepID=UPI001F165869|nr:PDR/VanB family oxidoreductase [Amycolatopsis sp. GM8]